MNSLVADQKAEELDRNGYLIIRKDDLQEVWKACLRRGIQYEAYDQPVPCGTIEVLRLEKK